MKLFHREILIGLFLPWPPFCCMADTENHKEPSPWHKPSQRWDTFTFGWPKKKKKTSVAWAHQLSKVYATSKLAYNRVAATILNKWLSILHECSNLEVSEEWFFIQTLWYKNNSTSGAGALIRERWGSVCYRGGFDCFISPHISTRYPRAIIICSTVL